MKKLLIVILCLLSFLISCKEEKYLNLQEEDKKITLEVGEEVKIRYEVSANETVIATNSNPEVAIFKNGIIKAYKTGSCEITLFLISDSSINETIHVTVISSLEITSDNLNYELKVDEVQEFNIQATNDLEIIVEVNDDKICVVEGNKIIALQEGSTTINLYLKDYPIINLIINVTVLPKNKLSFTDLELFGSKITIIRKEINKSKKLEETEEVEEFLAKIKKIYFIEADFDPDLQTMLYKIESNNNNICIYTNNFFTINAQKYELTKDENEIICDFSFLDNYEYTENVDSGWLPWV